MMRASVVNSGTVSHEQKSSLNDGCNKKNARDKDNYGVIESDGKHFKGASILKEGGDNFRNIKEEQTGHLISVPLLLFLFLLISTSVFGGNKTDNLLLAGEAHLPESKYLSIKVL